jgi:hypothetical protein
LIIDKDDWEEIHNYNFDKLVDDCKKETNFFLAMSNPCFEIWLILHLKDISEFDQEEKSLISANKKVSKNKNYIDKVLGDIQGRGYNKKPNPDIFLPLTKTAIRRAKELDTEAQDYPKQLGTHVYKLIEKLMAER